MREMKQNLWAKRLPVVSLLAPVAFAVLAAGPLPAQEPTARAYVEPAEVELGEPFRFVIEVSGVSEAQAPDYVYFIQPFTDPSVNERSPFVLEITAPTAGQIGGSVTFTYSLVAKVAGSFEVHPLRIIADGRRLETAPSTFRVTLPDPGAVSVRARLGRTEVEVMEEFELIVDVTPADVVLQWPVVPDLSDFANYMQRNRRETDGSMVFPYVASVAGTHEIGPVVFEVGEETYRTESVTLVVAGEPPALEARASINTDETWVGSDVHLVIEVPGVSVLDADPVLPDMSGFAERVRGGGTGIWFGGGQPTARRAYRIRVTTAGEFEIGPVQVMAAGRTALTEPLRLVIREALPPAPVESPEDVLATATADKRRAYVGEPVTVTYRALARDSRRRHEWRVEQRADTFALPEMENFRIETIGSGGRWERIEVDGRSYRVASQRDFVFFALAPGGSTIRSAEFTIQVHQSRWSSLSSPVEDPGRFVEMTQAQQAGTWTPMILATDPIPLEVVPLPGEGRPESFRGHVGRLEVGSRVDRTHLVVGDTMTLRVEVSRDGPSMAAPDPEVAFPDGFEVMDPEIDDTGVRRYTLSGTRVYSYRLVATQEGSFRIPAVEMSWFDPESGSYTIVRTQPFDLTVVGAGRDGGG
ncbi:MAG: protein BatD [Gemmatimonadetes bacterium]|nr:protein BatD [Gemmatimonadota bacterium]MYH54057.1 protein BatD [Gemmatimonadota bacterium]MYK66399.1 protein BatD [Gemmatimonadota bacterium]